MDNRIAALNKMQEDFIVSRTHQETMLSKWIASLGTMPEDLYKSITETVPITKDTTVKDLIPEWWEQFPDKAKAKEQVDTVNGYLEKVDKIIETYLIEGARLSDEVTRRVQGGM